MIGVSPDLETVMDPVGEVVASAVNGGRRRFNNAMDDFSHRMALLENQAAELDLSILLARLSPIIELGRQTGAVDGQGEGIWGGIVNRYLPEDTPTMMVLADSAPISKGFISVGGEPGQKHPQYRLSPDAITGLMEPRGEDQKSRLPSVSYPDKVISRSRGGKNKSGAGPGSGGGSPEASSDSPPSPDAQPLDPRIEPLMEQLGILDEQLSNTRQAFNALAEGDAANKALIGELYENLQAMGLRDAIRGYQLESLGKQAQEVNLRNVIGQADRDEQYGEAIGRAKLENVLGQMELGQKLQETQGGLQASIGAINSLGAENAQLGGVLSQLYAHLGRNGPRRGRGGKQGPGKLGKAAEGAVGLGKGAKDVLEGAKWVTMGLGYRLVRHGGGPAARYSVKGVGFGAKLAEAGFRQGVSLAEQGIQRGASKIANEALSRGLSSLDISGVEGATTGWVWQATKQSMTGPDMAPYSPYQMPGEGREAENEQEARVEELPSDNLTELMNWLSKYGTRGVLGGEMARAAQGLSYKEESFDNFVLFGQRMEGYLSQLGNHEERERLNRAWEAELGRYKGLDTQVRVNESEEDEEGRNVIIPQEPEVRTDVPVWHDTEVILGREVKIRRSPRTKYGHDTGRLSH
jgi:hypothetical protein